MSKFKIGDKVRKVSGSQWHGTVVGTYSTELTPEGYAVESFTEKGSVQIYPAKALELWEPASKPWVGLTSKEREELDAEAWHFGPEAQYGMRVSEMTEAKLREKNA